MNGTIFTAGLCVLFAACVQFMHNNIKLVQVEDEDIKIAGNNFNAKGKGEEYSSDLAAKQFLEQKESGNIDKARALGKTLAQALLQQNKELFGKGVATVEPVHPHHQMLLYSYALNRVVSEHSPNSIVAQTVLNVFYNELETASAEMYQHVCDMAAFSLYILCERSEKRKSDEIGKTYASLCDDESFFRIDEGNRLYSLYYAYCLNVHRQALFLKV